jgi:hypothetical protein
MLNNKAVIYYLFSIICSIYYINLAIASDAGTLEGSLGFPSEGIPKNMKVCAQNEETREIYCTKTHIKYKNGEGYRLGIPAGNYKVYSEVSGYPDLEGYKAYYSDFVKCGLNIKCSSHKPVIVGVLPGKTTSGVDPIN